MLSSKAVTNVLPESVQYAKMTKAISYILIETAASKCAVRGSSVFVLIQGHTDELEIPLDEFIYAVKTRADPPHYRVRYLQPHILDAAFVKHKDVFFSIYKDSEGNNMIVRRRNDE